MARRRTVRAVQGRQELRRQGLVADPRGLPARRHRRPATGTGTPPSDGDSRGSRPRPPPPQHRRRSRAAAGSRRSAAAAPTAQHRAAPGDRADPRDRRAAGRPHDRPARRAAADPGAGAGGRTVGERREPRRRQGHRPPGHDQDPRRQHGRVAHGSDRDQRAHDPGEADDRQPHRHQQPHVAHPRRQDQLHAPHRLGAHPGAQGVPEPERVLRRDRRQAVGRGSRAHQPRHRDRPARSPTAPVRSSCRASSAPTR